MSASAAHRRTIAIVEHGTPEARAIAGMNGELFRKVRDRLGYSESRVWNEADVVIAHWSIVPDSHGRNELSVELPKWMDCNATGKLVCVLVSRHGRAALRDFRPIARQSSGGGTMYVIAAWNDALLRSEADDRARCALLQMVAGDAEAIIAGNLDDLDLTLRTVFFGTEVNTITGLAMLMQGYLVVHAKGSGGEMVDDPAGGLEVALGKMGWTTGFTDRLREGSCLVGCVSGGEAGPAELGGKRELVRDCGSAYWNALSGAANLRGLIIDELRGASGRVGSEMPGDVEWVIQRIVKKEQLDNPSRVANAYIELATVLMSSR